LLELEAVLGKLARSKESGPSETYWSSLLPRVREKIEERSSRRIPAWLSGIAVPAAAAVIVFLVLLRFPSTPPMNEELSSILDGLTSEEVEPLVDEEIVTTVLAGGILSPDVQDNTDDRSIIATLIDDDIPESLSGETDATSMLEGFSTDDIDRLTSLLEQQDGNMAN
jgi:hypothetical protein